MNMEALSKCFNRKSRIGLQKAKEIAAQHLKEMKSMTLEKLKAEMRHEQVKKIIDEIKPDRLRNWITYLREMDKELSNCYQCRGLDNCKNRYKGERFVVFKAPNGGIYNGSRQCQAEAKREEMTQQEKIVKSSRISERQKLKVFDNFIIREENKIAIKYAKKCAYGLTDRGMLLSGKSGVGKTHLMSAIMNEMLRNGQKCLFVTVPDLMQDLRDSCKESEPTRHEKLDTIIDTEYLFLDDLGAEKPTEWAIEQLFRIINARYLTNRMTFVTTNYDGDKLERRLTSKDGEEGKRIVSRLVEMCAWFELEGEDQRRN